MENKQTLTQLVLGSQEIILQLTESGGELTPEMEKSLAEIEVKLPQKIDGYSNVMDRLDNEEQYWKNKAAQFNAVAKGCANIRERLKESIKHKMTELKINELKGNEYRFKLSATNPSVVIEDESKVDAAYKITETITKIDKKRITEDLKLGVPVIGAVLQENTSIRKYVNRGDK